MDRPIFDEQDLRQKIDQLEARTTEPDFWSDRPKAEKITRELAGAKNTVQTWNDLQTEWQDLSELAQMTDETDTKTVTELQKVTAEFKAKLSEAELTLYLSGEYDHEDAILTIHAGAGGIDAADWASMILRMYLRYAEQKGWQTKILEKSETEESGIKSATITISGSYAYGFLKGEKGAHRLVRRSPFNAAKSRETSFAKVEVLPVVPESNDVEIRAEDLRIDTFMSGGAGGQSVNTTYSAVRITHLPTSIVASCQNERSQQQNRLQALSILRSKIAERRLEEAEARTRELRGEPLKADFGGDAIRSYILDDRRVKDRRTGYETFDPEAVLDGDLEPFIRAYLTSLL